LFKVQLFTLALVLTAIWLLIIGLGLVGLGVPPSGEEVARSLLFLLATIAYGGIWLALGMVFSVVFRQPASAALAAIAVWLFFTAFWGILASLIAQAVLPIQYGLPDEIIAQIELELALSRVSPNTLYSEAMLALLQPTLRSVGFVLPVQLQGALLGSPLPVDQSLAIIWPQLTGLIAATIVLFALAYMLFQRQEIRA
jgi:ABC-2 type transport system permease protein